MGEIRQFPWDTVREVLKLAFEGFWEKVGVREGDHGRNGGARELGDRGTYGVLDRNVEHDWIELAQMVDMDAATHGGSGNRFRISTAARGQPMRITRVYTRTGDKGQTGLVGGERVSKDHVRIEAYGAVDELNAVLGIVRSVLRRCAPGSPVVERLDPVLGLMQNELFNVGADLATRPKDRWPGMHRIGEPEVTRLEGWCDAFNESLPPLQNFILPGGGEVAAFLHQARTVCRRAEREVVRLMHAEPETGDECMRYLNRLSDLLFVLGRWVAVEMGEPEVLWEQPAKP